MQNFVGKTKCIAGYMKVANCQANQSFALCKRYTVLRYCQTTTHLLLMTFPCARKLGNICCRHKMFLNKIRNIFCVRKSHARANGETFVSATMCPRYVCQGFNFMHALQCFPSNRQHNYCSAVFSYPVYSLPKKKRWRPAWLHVTFMISCNIIGNFLKNGSFQSRSVHGR